MTTPRRNDLLAVAVLAILGAVPVTWFLAGEGGVVSGYDFATSIKPVDDLLRSVYLWDERLYAGAANVLAIGAMPYFLLQFVLERLTGSLAAGQMLFFTLLLTMPGLAMYVFLRNVFTKNPERLVLSFFGALFYMLNTFVVVKWNRGELVTLFAYGTLPLYLTLVERTLKRGLTTGLAAVILAALFFFPVPLGHSADFLIITGVITAFTLFRVASGPGRTLRLKRAGLLAAVFVLAGSWWFLPLAGMVFGGGGGMAGFEATDLSLVHYYSSWATLLNLMKMWFFSMYATAVEFNTQVYRPGTLLFPMIGFSTLLYARRARNPNIVFFALLGLAGLWLAKGTSRPLPSMYEWMYTHLPFFFVFRAPSRYFPLVYTLSLAVLFGVAVAGAYAFVKARLKGRPGGLCRGALVAGAAALVFFHAWPIFKRDVIFRSVKNDVLHPSVFVKVPGYYERLEEWLSTRDGYFRVHSFHDSAYLNYTWGYSSTDIATKVITAPQTVRFPQELTFGAAGFTALARGYSEAFWSWDFSDPAGLLGLLSSRYITVVDDVMRRYLPDTNYYEILGAVLENAPGIEPVAAFGSARVYENTAALPHFYASSGASLLLGGAGSLVTLGAEGSLSGRSAPPAYVMADSPEAAGKLPAGSIDELLFVETNIYDLALSSDGALARITDMSDAGFVAPGPGLYSLWGLPAPAGAGAGPVVKVDGAAAKLYRDGPTAIRWTDLGLFELPEGSHRITVTPAKAYKELKVMTLAALDEKVGALAGTIGSTGLDSAVVMRPGALGPSREAAFYSQAKEVELSVAIPARFKRKRVAGLALDHLAAPDPEQWVLLDGGTVAATPGGLSFTLPPGRNGMKTARRLIPSDTGGGAAPFDPERFPYAALDFTGSPAGLFEVEVSVGIDVTGNGWADDEVSAGVFTVGSPSTVDLSQSLKDKYGYPGKETYTPRWVALNLRARTGQSVPPVDPGVTAPGITVRGLSFYHEVPDFTAERDAAEPVPLGVFIDGEPALLVGVKGGATKLSLEPGTHTMALRPLEADGAPSDELSPVVRVSTKGAREGRGAAPALRPGKINPALYVVGLDLPAGGPGFWVVFNESYNAGWRAYLRRADASARPRAGWLGTLGLLWDDSEVVELSAHAMMNGYANGWWVDTEKAAALGDGTGPYELVVEYAPQRRLLAGVLLSGFAITATMVLVPLFTVSRKRNFREKEVDDEQGR